MKRLGEVAAVRPLREESQVEVAGSDQFILGIEVPIREGGNLRGTPGITIEGPRGRITIPQGVIRQQRHLHLPDQLADRLKLRSRDFVQVRADGEHEVVCGDVLVRTSGSSVAEIHLDADEGAAAHMAASAQGHVLAS